MKPGALVTSLFLLLIALAHVARLAFQVEVTAGGLEIPMWMSAVAAGVTAALAIWLRREA